MLNFAGFFKSWLSASYGRSHIKIFIEPEQAKKLCGSVTLGFWSAWDRKTEKYIPHIAAFHFLRQQLRFFMTSGTF
jgi:hypothetical protein